VRPDGAEYCAEPPGPQVDFRRYDRGMRPFPLVLGVLLVLAGLVWVAQGLDLPFAPSSFMTADRAWVLIGAATVLAGAVCIGWARGSRAAD
jgi:hypothetical protein